MSNLTYINLFMDSFSLFLFFSENESKLMLACAKLQESHATAGGGGNELRGDELEQFAY